jgi:hypothetical protein
VSAFQSWTHLPYLASNIYVPYTYKLTSQEALNDCPIPSVDRQYSIDRTTGIVTVIDKTGTYPSQQLAYRERNTFKSRDSYTNGSPSVRRGVEWIIDFAEIRALKTSVRFDGQYYYYRGVDQTIDPYLVSSAQSMADGSPYKYIGYFVGGSSMANGGLTKQTNANVTIITHIPKIRLICSLRVEGSLYNFHQNLCEQDGSPRGFVIDSPEEFFGNDYNIYQGNKYVAVYPLYYTSWDDPDTKIPFAEKLAWAKVNDTALYNELVKMVQKSNTLYYFNSSRISSYFSANINVTKEIGNSVSLSFFANNFFNHTGRVRSSQTGLESSLYGSGRIPSFYYGMALRLKL